jgi:uncharacterized membrane protein
MAAKIRNFLAIFAGAFGLVQSYLLYKGHTRDWHLWGEVTASVLLLGLGVWRIFRRPIDPTTELLK